MQPKKLSAFALMAVLSLAVTAALADDKKDCSELDGQEGINACTRAIESGKFRGTELGELYYNRGVGYLDEQQIDRAIADYNESIKHDPKNAEAFFNRGRAFIEKGELDRAIEDYTASIKVDPKNANAFNNRGRAWQEKGDNTKALPDYNQAIKLDPELAHAHENRADILFAMNNFKEAVSGYDKALKIDPDRVWSLYGRGLAKLKGGDETGGKADIEAANKKDKDIAAEFNKQLGVK